MRTRTRRLARWLFALVLCCGAAAPPATAEPVAAITPGNVLIRFDTASPASITSVGPVTGLGMSDTIRGMDVRPFTGQVFIFTVISGSAANSTIKTYDLDINTGAATLVGVTAAALAGGADLPTGTDFNPTVDRVRYANTNDENARLNPTNGALAGNDTDLTPAATTTVIGEAYDRNRLGQPATTLYAIDRNDSQVGIQGGIDGNPSPNAGVVTDLAPLGFTLHAANDGGFDVSPSGRAYAALTSTDNITRLYSLTLPTAMTATPAATDIGQIGSGNFEVRTLAVLDDDRESDGVLTSADNCDTASNADQANADGDGEGDACDSDDDADGLADSVDNCTAVANADQADQDADGIGDACEGDRDGDGVADAADICPSVADSAQANLDEDALGDACDGDDDGDGASDADEAAMGTNPAVADSDGDGRADGSDACALAPGTVNGCPAPVTPVAFASSVTGCPKSVRVRRLRRRGLACRVEPNVPARYVAELVGRLKGGHLAAVGQLVLAERRLPLAGGRRTIRLRVPKSQRSRLQPGIRLRVRVTAKDALGRTDTDTRTVRLR